MKNHENPEERITTSEAIRKDFTKNILWYLLKEKFAHAKSALKGEHSREHVQRPCHMKETSCPENRKIPRG